MRSCGVSTRGGDHLLRHEAQHHLGSYPLTAAHERLTIIVTRPLPAPRSDPQPGFKLSAGQFAALEAFKKQWGGWLSGQVALPSPSFLTRLEQLGLFRP